MVKFGEHFSAWITLEKEVEPLIEYDVSSIADQAGMKCWIPSVEGATFVVHWKDEGSGFDTAGYIRLDGNTVPGRFLWGSGKTYRTGYRSGKTGELPFLFGTISENASGSKKHEEVGTIVLQIKKILRDQKTPFPANEVLPAPTPELSGGRQGDHRICYGNPRPYYEQHSSTWGFKSQGACATFIFRYRPLDFLKAQGIAPDSASLTIANAPQRHLISTHLRLTSLSVDQAQSPTSTAVESQATTPSASQPEPPSSQSSGSHYGGSSLSLNEPRSAVSRPVSAVATRMPTPPWEMPPEPTDVAPQSAAPGQPMDRRTLSHLSIAPIIRAPIRRDVSGESSQLPSPSMGMPSPSSATYQAGPSMRQSSTLGPHPLAAPPTAGRPYAPPSQGIPQQMHYQGQQLASYTRQHLPAQQVLASPQGYAESTVPSPHPHHGSETHSFAHSPVSTTSSYPPPVSQVRRGGEGKPAPALGFDGSQPRRPAANVTGGRGFGGTSAGSQDRDSRYSRTRREAMPGEGVIRFDSEGSRSRSRMYSGRYHSGEFSRSASPGRQ